MFEEMVDIAGGIEVMVRRCGPICEADRKVVTCIPSCRNTFTISSPSHPGLPFPFQEFPIDILEPDIFPVMPPPPLLLPPPIAADELDSESLSAPPLPPDGFVPNFDVDDPLATWEV